MTRALLVMMLVAACGRFGFDPNGDARSDAPAPDSGFVGTAQTTLRPAVSDPGDLFGQVMAVSMDGATIVAGSESEDSSATGVNGNAMDNGSISSGAAYVFRRSGAIWGLDAYLKQSNTNPADRFSFAIAVSGDGTTIAIGAPGESSIDTGIDGNQLDTSAVDAGAVYVFVRSGSVWTQQAYVKASNTGAFDSFGFAVALSADGSVLAVGAPGEDSGGRGVNADQGDDSATDGGSAYLFVRTGTVWSQQAYLKASNTDAFDRFGAQVALSGPGATLAVAAVNEASAATGINGAQADNGALGAGAVYVFTRAGTAWSQQAYIKASNTGVNDGFGTSLSLAGDGDTLLATSVGEDSAATGVGGDQADETAPDAGAAYVFTRAGTTWSQQAYLKAGNTGADDSLGFNASVSADGSTIAIGAEKEDSSGTGLGADPASEAAQNSGAVYVYARSAGSWLQRAFVKATNTGPGDYFGDSVGLSSNGGTLVVGARFEDGPGETLGDSGAIYVYE